MNKEPTITRVEEGGRKKIVIGMPPIAIAVGATKLRTTPKEANKDG